ncbi:MAG: hypothetical protein KQJ78_07725 [Deltaproteobacteria bacterium]|nr:hypothetical protein [Deltaproteobacteria bacterium]
MAPSANFLAWIAAGCQRVYTAELGLIRLSDGEALTVYLAGDGGYWDGAHYYFPAISKLPSVERQAQQFDNGQAMITYGSLEFLIDATADVTGGLTMDDLLTDYAWAGGDITIRCGARKPSGAVLPWSEWAVVLVGVMEAPKWDDQAVTLGIKSRDDLLAKTPMPDSILTDTEFPAWETGGYYFAGSLVRPTTANGFIYSAAPTSFMMTGGATEPAWPTAQGATVTVADGDWVCCKIPSVTEGKPRPITLGYCRDIPLVLFEDVQRYYMFHEGIRHQHPRVNGTLKLAFLTASSGWHFRPTGHEGDAVNYVELDGDPVGNPTLTFTPTGMYDPVVYCSLEAIVQQIITDYVEAYHGVSIDTELGGPHFLQYFGIHIDSQSNALDVLSSLTHGTLCMFGFDREGVFRLRKLVPPEDATPVMEFDDDHDTFTVSAEVEPRIYSQTRIGYGLNYSKGAEVDSTADAATRAYGDRDYVWQEVKDDTIKAKFPLATVAEFGTCGADMPTVAYPWLTIAGQLAQEYLDLFGMRRLILTLETTLPAMTLDLGDVVSVKRNRWGLDAGKNFTVLSLTENHQEGRIELRLWGGVS